MIDLFAIYIYIYIYTMAFGLLFIHDCLFLWFGTAIACHLLRIRSLVHINVGQSLEAYM